MQKNKKEQLGEHHKNFTSLINKSFNNTINAYLNNYNDKNLKNKLMIELELTQEDLKKLESEENINPSVVNPFSLIKSLKNIIDSLNQIEPNEQFIKDLSSKYNEITSDIEEKKIRIPILGEYSSGKSSLLNKLIGHDFNIIPVDIKVCTNIALVIKNTKNIKNISLFHTFLEQTPQNFYFFKYDKEPLSEDLNSINLVLNLINILYSSFKDNEDLKKLKFMLLIIFIKSIKKRHFYG